MCGIVGAVALASNGFPHTAANIFTQLLAVDILRGPDSTGYFMVDNTGKVGYGKVASHPSRLFASKGYAEAMRQLYARGQLIIGHNRKATVGDVNNANAHPHHHEHIIMVHNGGLWNHKDHGKFDVDSMAIPKLLAEHDDPKEALAKMHGHFAIVWYNAKTDTLHWARNKDRPLTMAKFGTVMYLGSEQKMLEWIIDRQGSSVQVTYEDVSPEILYSFNLLTRKVSTEGFKFKSWSNTYNSRRNGADTDWSKWSGQTRPPVGPQTSGTEDPWKYPTTTDKIGSAVSSTFRATSIDRTDATRPILVGKTLGNDPIEVRYKIKLPSELSELFKAVARPKNVFRGTLGHQVYQGTRIKTQWMRTINPVKMYKTWNGEWFTGDDWAAIAKGGKCSTCASHIALKYIKYTSVNMNSGTGQPRIVCPECIARKLNSSDVTAIAKANIEAAAGAHINDYFAEKEKERCHLRVVQNESANSETPVLLLPSTHTK